MGQDQESVKLDTKQTIVEICALDGEGYVHKKGGQNMSASRWCYKQNTAFRRERKREKVTVGPGSRVCKVGYETNICGDLRVRWRGLRALGESGQNTRVSKWVLQTELGRYKT